MIAGISARIKDRRIDGLLKKMGYDLALCEIFYSPITGYLFYLGVFFIFTLPLSVYFLFFIIKYWYCFLLYFFIQYLLLASLNNTYVIFKEKIIVINPNLPFKKVTVYELDTIKKIKIDNTRVSFVAWLFFIFKCNYVEIYTADKSLRYFSVFLEVDFYDENITEKTMDDFYSALCKHQVSAEMNL